MTPPELSPDFEPESPFIDRRPLSPRTEARLRDSCLFILQVQDPSTSSRESKARDSHATGRIGRELQRKASYTAEALSFKRRASESRGRGYSDPRETLAAGPAVPTYKHVPTNAAASFNRTATSRSASVNRGRSDSLNQLDQGLALDRPHTAAPVYESSSTSTNTHSWTTSDNAQSRSTGITTMPSVSHTPAEYQDPEAQARADARARAWMAEELARRRAEQSRPSSRSSNRFIDYLRPRSSKESMRTMQTEDSSASSWWRGSTIQRQNSVGSQRGYADEYEAPVLREIDLNRPLPPLPSLSTWDSETPKAKAGHGSVHVTKVVTAHSNAQREPATPSDRRAPRSGKAKHRSQRSLELQQMVDEKMRVGTIDFPPPAAAQPHGPKDLRDPSSRVPQQSQQRKASAKVRGSDEMAQGSGDNKMSRLKRQFSKLGLGGLATPKQPKYQPRTYSTMLNDMGTPHVVRAR